MINLYCLIFLSTYCMLYGIISKQYFRIQMHVSKWRRFCLPFSMVTLVTERGRDSAWPPVPQSQVCEEGDYSMYPVLQKKSSEHRENELFQHCKSQSGVSDFPRKWDLELGVYPMMHTEIWAEFRKHF